MRQAYPKRSKPQFKTQSKTSWSKVSRWYSDLVGESGQYFHQKVILPNVLKLMSLKKGDAVLDLGCGEGILERAIPEGVDYLGVDIAETLIKEARKKAKFAGHRFTIANLSRPWRAPQQFSHATCLLALQNMADGQQCIKNATQALHKNGQFIIVLNHPSFRIPRQTSWEIDKQNKLQYRRVNRYLSELEIPIEMRPGQQQKKMTWSYHHPLSTYFSWLKSAGFVVEDCQEWVSDKESKGAAAKMENRSREEFPLFLCIVARRI